MRVFQPNLTSNMLIECSRNYISEKSSILDLGCGSGFVGIELAKSLGLPKVFFSDLDAEAEEIVKKSAQMHGIESDFRHGSIFQPWNGMKFDLIINDVSGVAEKIAKISPWFEHVPCSSGNCGSKLIGEVLKKSNIFLEPKGTLIFPIISLSNRNKILNIAENCFSRVELLKKKEWFLPEEMQNYVDLLGEEKINGNANFENKFGKVVCYTEIYNATNP